MKKAESSENKHRTAYKKPELVCYGSLSSITRATSAGTINDNGTMPNSNTRMS